jgi:hypothetical protein
MAKRQKERILDALGWFFIVLGITTAGWYVLFSRWQYAFWFCNHAMIIAGIALLKRNKFWTTATLNWALVPVSMWVIDFAGKVLFDAHVLGITEYMFIGPWWGRILSLQHLFTVPLLLYALQLLGAADKNAWLGTTAHGAILWLISYFIITPDYNVNCAHEACQSWLRGEYYVVLWPLIAVALFYLTNAFLVWLLNSRAARRQARARQRK